MAWDAGSISSELDVDLSPFHHGLERAKAEAREFADKRYTATVDINTRRSDDELQAVEQRLHSIESSIDRIGSKTGGGGGGRGFGGRGGIFSRLPNPSFMALGIGAAIPAAVPFAGLAGGIAGGALSAGVAGGLGLGAFGLGAKSSITTITGDITKLNKLTAQYNAATTNKQRAAVLAKEAELWKALDPRQRQAVKNVQALDAGWAHYKKQLEPQTFAVVADGAKIGNTALKYLLPTAQAVGDELDDMAKRAERAFKAPFWHQFFGDFLPGEAARSVDALGTTLGHLGTGVGHLVQDFAPLAHLLEGGSESISARFEKWTEGAGPGKFVAWVEKEGPPAGKALESIAKGVKGLAVGFAPIGQLELKALTPILNFLGKLGDEHPEVITAIGGALLTLGAGLKAVKLVGSIPGLGRIGGGGGFSGGGIIGKGTPVPVYVTNWQGGPGGHPPGAAGAGATTAEETAAAAAGGGVLSRLRTGARTAVRSVGPAAATALATTNIIDNQTKLAHANILTRALNAVGAAGVFGTQTSELGRNIPTVPYNAALANAPKAGNQPYTGGGIVRMNVPTKEDTQQEKDAAASVGLLNKYLVINTGLAGPNAAAIDRQAAALRRQLSALSGLPSYLKDAEAAASSGGLGIGKNLADGITFGIHQGGDKVAIEMVSVVKGALHAGKTTAQLSSPSKITTQYGRWIAEGLAVGFTAFSPQLDKAFSGTTKTALNRLGSHVNNAANQYRADLSARAQLGASITGNIMGGASLANATLSNTGGATVGGYLSDQISQLAPFRSALNQLRAKKLDPRLIQQISDAGPLQGLALAQSILSGESGSVRGLNKQESTIASLAGGIGSTVSGAVFGGQISKDQASLVHMVNLLDRMLTKKLDLSPHAEAMMERAFIRALRAAFPSLSLKDLGHAGAIKIRSAR